MNTILNLISYSLLLYFPVYLMPRMLLPIVHPQLTKQLKLSAWEAVLLFFFIPASTLSVFSENPILLFLYSMLLVSTLCFIHPRHNYTKITFKGSIKKTYFSCKRFFSTCNKKQKTIVLTGALMPIFMSTFFVMVEPNSKTTLNMLSLFIIGIVLSVGISLSQYLNEIEEQEYQFHFKKDIPETSIKKEVEREIEAF